MSRDKKSGSDSSQERTILPIRLNRRNLMIATGVGITSIGDLSQTAAAQTVSTDEETGVEQNTSAGDEIWSFDTGNSVYSSPTVVDGTVFVGRYDGNLYALNAGDGSEIWSSEAGNLFDSSPTVIDGTVFVGSEDGNVYAFGVEDGSEIWSSEAGNLVSSSPTVVDGTVFIGSYDGNVYAFDVEDGSEIWSFDTGEPVSSSPTVVDGTVFVGSHDGNVYGLNAGDGSEIWSSEAGNLVSSSPTVVDGTVFVGSEDGNVYGLNAGDGSEIWSSDTGEPVYSSPTVVDGTVFVGSDDGNVYAFDAEDGSEVWSFDTGEPVASSPTVVDGTVFIGSYDGNVYGLNAGDGSEVWSFDTGEPVSSSPTVVDGTVFVGSDDGNVYAFDAGVDGSSEGSRVNLGTLGHHNKWNNNNSSEGSSPSSEIIFEEDFESYSPDEAPSDFVFAGNSDQGVTDSVSQTGDQSYRMSGSHGGCWEAIMRRELFSADERPDAMRIQGSFRLGDGSTGCHSNSDISWRTVDSSDWSDGSGPSILNFDMDGTITAAGETVGEYNRYEWVDFTVEYEYNTEANEVIQRCTVSNSDPVTVIREERSNELELTSLELKSGDYTVYWDDFVIEQIDGVNESPGENLNPSISQSTGTTTPEESVTFDASDSSGDINRYDWQLGDGTTATGTSVSHTYEQPDTYTVTLTTRGTDGTTAKTTTEIAVTEKDELAFSVQPASPVVGQSITFEATGGDEYDWSFGNETTASGQQVTHTYDTEATYTVTLTGSSDSVSRELQIESSPITVTEISRKFGGVPLESISYEDTFQATIESENQLETVEFEIGDQSKTATKNEDMWQASFDLGQFDASDILTVTATDSEGFEAASRQSVSIIAIPEWMEWLLEPADINVNESNTRIDISYDPFNLDSFTFDLGGIPIDVDPPEFDGTPQAEIGYDAGQQAAILDGDGEIEGNLFGYGLAAGLEVEGEINADLDLIEASGEAEASLSGQVGPPLYVNVPPGIPCLDDRLGIETTVSPGVELEAAFDGEFNFEQGTAIPETVITVGAQLDICGAGAGAEIEGDLQSSFDIGTDDPNLSGTVEGSGEAWINIHGLQTAFDVGFEVTLPASSTQAMVMQSQNTDVAEWNVVNKHGTQPEIDVATVDEQGISTTSSGISPLAPSDTTNSTYQRLTDRSLEDSQPTIASRDDETVVMWSSQREAATASAGRDIAYRIETETGWEEVTYLTAEDRPHEAPDAAVSDGAVLAAWEYVNTDISDQTGISDLHPHVEIAYALYDGESWSDTTVLTDSEAREFQPTVTATDAGWLIAWEQSTDPEPGSGQRNVRYTQISSDGTTESITDISDAIYPDTGQYTGSGAVLGYASLNTGEPTETVASQIVDGAKTDSQRFDASSVRAVTVGENRLIWQEGDVSDPTFIEGDRTTGTTNELTVRDEVVATAEPTLATEGDKAVLSYRAYIGDGDTRELVYRLNRGSGWIFDRQFVQAPQADQSVWQPQSAFGGSVNAFKTVFAISSQQRDSKNDIFLTEHDFLPEYAIAAEGPSGSSAGDTITIDYSLRNRGDIDGSQSVTVTVSNTTASQAMRTYSGLAAGETVSDSISVPVDETGEFELEATTDDTSLNTAVATSDDFDVETTTVRVATPQLRVEEISTTGSDTVAITVSNTGGATAFDVPLSVTDGENELSSTIISEIGYNETATTEVTIDPSDIDRSSEDTIVLDPTETLPDAVSDTAQTTPTWLLQPDLRLTGEVKYRTGSLGQIVAEVLAGNGNPVSGSGTIQAITQDGTVVGETNTTIAGATGGTRYKSVKIPLSTSVTEGDDLRFEIVPEVPDADPTTISTKDFVGPVFETDDDNSSVTEAVDNNNDDMINDTEVLTAIDYWQEKEPVPETDGEKISDSKILGLIEAWRNNKKI